MTLICIASENFGKKGSCKAHIVTKYLNLPPYIKFLRILIVQHLPRRHTGTVMFSRLLCNQYCKLLSYLYPLPCVQPVNSFLFCLFLIHVHIVLSYVCTGNIFYSCFCVIISSQMSPVNSYNDLSAVVIALRTVLDICFQSLDM